MAQAIAEDFGRAPLSPALQATLLRAREYASGQSHNQVTVEHLLLALSEDDDAALVLQSSRVDLSRLRHDVADYLGNLSDRSPGPTQPVVSPQLAEILKYATLAAKQGRRAKIDGAIVLAALVGDGRSMAASFLNAQGLTFEEAIRVLQRAAAPASAAAPAAAAARIEAPQPAAVAQIGANAEDILAAARDRVGRRTLPRPEPPPRPEPVQRSEARTDSHTDAQSEARVEAKSETGPAPRLGPVVNPTDRVAEAEAGLPGPLPASQPAAIAMPAAQDTPPRQDERVPPGDAKPHQAQPRAESPVFSAAASPAALALHEPAILPMARDAAGYPRPSPFPQSREPHSPATAPPDMHQPSPSDHPARPSSPTWAPPPLPVPPQPQAQTRMPPPALATSRSPMAPAPGPPEWTTRPDITPAPPWSDPAPRPTAMPFPGQLGGPASGYQHPPLSQPQARQPGPAPDAPRAPAIEPAQISHNLPKRMRVGRKCTVEVRIARAALAGGSSGPRPVSLRAEMTAFRAISVRVRGTKSAFAIEAGSPETQWDHAIGPTGRLAGEVAVWRFNISPLKATRADLHIIASARTVGADGVVADTILPDQVVTVRIGRDIGRTMRRFAGGSTIAVSSIVAVKLTEEFLGFDLMRLIRALIGF